MVYFDTKNPNVGTFWRVLEYKIFVYVMKIWYILRLFGIFYWYLVHVMGIWYILWVFGICYGN
jgi:hypothetical protein